MRPCKGDLHRCAVLDVRGPARECAQELEDACRHNTHFGAHDSTTSSNHPIVNSRM